MTKDEAIDLIDDLRSRVKDAPQKESLLWLRVIIAKIDDDEWSNAAISASFVLERR